MQVKLGKFTKTWVYHRYLAAEIRWEGWELGQTLSQDVEGWVHAPAK